MSPSARRMWDAYIAEIDRDRSSDFYEVFHFHDHEAGALELAQLVLAGDKRGSASLAWTYEHDRRSPPRSRSLSVMTDWRGAAMGIIETRRMEVVPFEEVTADFAAIEGEGDKSLRHWREGHWAYFTRECQRIGREPSPRMLVFCERFELVFPRQA